MSRTYRHRHRIPKGYKAIDKNDDTIVIDENGKEVWVWEFTGEYIRWTKYRSYGRWLPGVGYRCSIWDGWKTLYFGNRKVPVSNKVLKRFSSMGRHSWCREWDYYEKKSSRRATNMCIAAGDWDLLPQHEGKSKRYVKKSLRRYE